MAIDTDDEERHDGNEQSKEKNGYNENEEFSEQGIKIDNKDNEVEINTENILGQNEKALNNGEKDDIKEKKT